MDDRLGDDLSNLGDLDVVVSEPKAIGTEWRVVVVGGKAVAISRYKVRGRLSPSNMDVPRKVSAFAEECASRHSPAEVFSVDVCATPVDGLKVIEYTCFNCCGLYDAHVGDAIDAINNLLTE